ncbi:MAG: substrate-binding domain-containing protein [Burkholderiales bacterium]
MKKEKRIISVLLCLAMITTLLAACGQTPVESVAPSAAASEAAGQSAAVSESAGAETGKSSKELVYEQMAKDPLGLTGVPEPFLESRKDVLKALPKEQKGGLVIGYTTPLMGPPFLRQLIDELQVKCDEYGYTLLVQDGNGNIQTQIAQVEDFITQGVDVIIPNCLDITAMAPVMKKASEAGITVIATGGRAGLPEYNCVTSIVSAGYLSGWEVGTYAATKLYSKDKVLKTIVAIIDAGSSDSEGRASGFLGGWLCQSRIMDGNPYESQFDAIWEGYTAWKKLLNEGTLDLSSAGLNIVGLGKAGNPDADGGRKSTADFITANPDVDLILCENDAMYTGVEVNLNQYNLVPGKDVYIVCPSDGIAAGLQAIKDGKILCIGNNSANSVADAIMELVHMIFEEGYDASNMPGAIFTPTNAITIENVDEYWDGKAEVAKGAPVKFQTIDEYNAGDAASDNPFATR